MSRRANVIRHGLNHACGGSDPIPGICALPSVTVCVSFPDRVGDVETDHPGHLLGYWRLGDGASPFADTSGTSPAGDMAKTSGGTAMTDSITGAIPAPDDDGAVQFNNTTGALADYLHTNPSGSRFGLPNGPITAAAFVKPGSSVSAFDGLVVGSWQAGVSASIGWRLGVGWPSRAPFFQRHEETGTLSATVTGSSLIADEWVLLVGTYDPTDGYALYVDGVLVASAATGTLLTTGTGSGLSIGGMAADYAGQHESFLGGIDEVMVWDVALSSIEITDLFTSGQPCTPSSSDPGKVITATADGSVWAYPTVNVDGTRYDEILTGANLTSTDNTDGTVTLDASGGGGASPADTACWMPLTTTVGGDDVLVFDAGHSLIPTLVPF